MTTAFVAWWGAVLATVAIVLDIARYLAERVKIKVGVSYTLEPDHPQMIELSAANVGRRPVTLEEARLEFSDGFRMPVLPPFQVLVRDVLPRELTEGKACRLRVPYETVAKGEREMGMKVVAVVFRDTAGREYRRRFRLRPFSTNDS